MKRILLFLLLVCSINYAQTSGRLLLLSRDLEPETNNYIERVLADGGTIIDVNSIDRAYSLIGTLGLNVDSIKTFVSTAFGVKIQNENKRIIKMYSLYGNDMVQEDTTKAYVLNYNEQNSLPLVDVYGGVWNAGGISTSFPVSATQNFNLFGAYKATKIYPGLTIIGSSSPSNIRLRTYYEGSGKPQIYMRSDDGGTGAFKIGYSDANTMVVIWNNYNGSSSKGNRYLGNIATGTVTTPSFAGVKLEGQQWGDLLFTTENISAGTALIIEKFLSEKWGIFSDQNIIVFDGNSLTSGIGATDGWSYPDQVQTGNFYKYNFGVSGQTTAQMSVDAATQIDTLLKWQSNKILVVWAGSNDLAQGQSVNDTYNSLKTYCQDRRNAGWYVVVLDMIARDDIYISIDHDSLEARRLQFNLILKANSSTFCDKLIEIGSNENFNSKSKASNLTYYSSDKVHLNSVGYMIVSDSVQRVFNELFVNAAYPQHSNWLISINNATANPSLTMQGTGTIFINWGDGNTNSYDLTSTDQTIQHTYDDTSDYIITIYNALNITKVKANSDCNWKFDLKTIPRFVSYFDFNCQNTIYGNTSSVPQKMKHFVLSGGSGVVHINWKDFVSSIHMDTLIINGNNYLSGNNLAYLPGGVRCFSYSGNIVQTVAPSEISFPDTMYSYRFCPNNMGLYNATQVDNILIKLALVTTWAGSDRTIDLRCMNPARTTASDSAVATLVSKGVTVLTN